MASDSFQFVVSAKLVAKSDNVDGLGRFGQITHARENLAVRIK
jgi:hypothetical protein